MKCFIIRYAKMVEEKVEAESKQGAVLDFHKKQKEGVPYAFYGIEEVIEKKLEDLNFSGNQNIVEDKFPFFPNDDTKHDS